MFLLGSLALADVLTAGDALTLGTFRLDYEYEIEYENDFSVLVCKLHIIDTDPSHPMSFPLYLNTNM